jgi:hypothetical protein
MPDAVAGGVVRGAGLGADGVHSLLEFRYVTRVERPHGLPDGTRQYRVTRSGRHQYQDVTYQAYGVAVELDGRVAHPEERRWRDIRRDNASAVDGQQTLRYGWADMTDRPCGRRRGGGRAVRTWLGRMPAPLRPRLPAPGLIRLGHPGRPRGPPPRDRLDR